MNRLRHSARTALLILFLIPWIAPPGFAQGLGEYGDAPEGAVAYPATGVIGQFPTCLAGGGGTFVWHGSLLPNAAGWFGQTVDLETDGNGGLCFFPPYDQDECCRPVDLDAGLIMPDAFRITPVLQVAPCCPSVAGTALGPPCTMAVWGQAIDIHAQVRLSRTMYVNVLMDWDQNGMWGGASACPSGSAPEWVLVNFPVAPIFNGPLSTLSPPPFLIGPNAGYVWCRFHISESPITLLNWDGGGMFDAGESEDYLLRVGQNNPTTYEMGDAPEGAIAYPFTGVTGQFPTCQAIGPAGFVGHVPGQSLFFGPSIDAETDGNAGVCPPPPYDQDECAPVVDTDSGLLAPDAWTIAGGLPATCGLVANPRPLGQTCTPVAWGAGLDLVVTNATTNLAYFNALFDWDQSGAWSGQSVCPPGGIAPEWAVTNLPVPPGYSGPLSTLLPPAFQLGPWPGYLWCRFTLTDAPIASASWDGSGSFNAGETEDYLLLLAGTPPVGDYGDAPENFLAYPPAGTMGQFPTCTGLGPAGFVYHAPGGTLMLGPPPVDYETDGNAGGCVFPPYDQDECGQFGGDGALLRPSVYTIGAGGLYALCPFGAGTGPTPLGWSCLQSQFGSQLEVQLANNGMQTAWLNILVDWDQNGAWSGSSTCPNGMTTPEHLLINLAVPAGYAGPLSGLVSGWFWVPAQPGFCWMRVTLSDQPVVPGWDGGGVFLDGESEDYLVRIDPTQSGDDGRGAPPVPAFTLEAPRPNPFGPATTIAWSMPEAAVARVIVRDLVGRPVRTLLNERRDTGRQAVIWDGRDDLGHPLGSGLYFVTVEVGTARLATKVILTR